MQARIGLVEEAPRFFADAMLGTLARWLRVLGLDVLYEAHIDDADLVERAVAESRIILTRDRRLTERRLAQSYLLIASDDIEEQLRQVVTEIGPRALTSTRFGRCLECNHPLEEISPEEASDRVPPYVARTQTSYRHCSRCDRIFWRATHVEQMEQRLRSLGLGPRSAS